MPLRDWRVIERELIEAIEADGFTVSQIGGDSFVEIWEVVEPLVADDDDAPIVARVIGDEPLHLNLTQLARRLAG